MAEKTQKEAAETAQPLTVLKNCRHGKMLFLSHDKYIGRSLDTYGEFSELEAELFYQILRPGNVVVEVGANIGAHTVNLAKLVGPQGMVIAFEPQRIIFQILCANVAMNDLFNVHTRQEAVGREAGTLRVPQLDYAAENNFGGLSLQGGTAGEEVPVRALDSVNLPSLSLLKVDVEGMEAEALAGARGLIAKHRPFLYVENDRQRNSRQLISLIDELGYNMWWHMPPLFNPANYAKVSNNIFGDIVSINLFCAPKESPLNVAKLRKVTGPDDWWRNPPQKPSVK